MIDLDAFEKCGKSAATEEEKGAAAEKVLYASLVADPEKDSDCPEEQENQKHNRPPPLY